MALAPVLSGLLAPVWRQSSPSSSYDIDHDNATAVLATAAEEETVSQVSGDTDVATAVLRPPTSTKYIESFDTSPTLPSDIAQYKNAIVAQRDAHWTLNPLAFETDWRKRFCLERHSEDGATHGKYTTVLHFFMRSSDIEFRLRNVVITDDEGSDDPNNTTVLVSTSPQEKAHFEHFAVHPLVVPDPHNVCLDCTAPKTRFSSKRFHHTHLHSAEHNHIRSLHPLEHAWLSNESATRPEQMRLEGFFNLSTLDSTSMACSILNHSTWVRVSMIGEERVTRNMMMLALEQVLRLPLRTLYPVDELVPDESTRLGDCLLAECEVRKFIDYASVDAHIFGDAQRPVLYEASSYVLDQQQQQQVVIAPTTPPKPNVMTRSNASSFRLSETTPTITITTPPRASATCSASSKSPPSIKARRRRMQTARRYKGY